MSLNEENLEEWLASRSNAFEHSGNQLVFTHATGEKTVLIASETSHRIEAAKAVALPSFFMRYNGASFGDGQILIGTLERGGITCVTGDVIPDLEVMREQAVFLGFPEDPSVGMIFMMEAAWMFIYSFRNEKVFCYDRDYRVTSQKESMYVIIEEWWRMVSEDKI